MEADVIFKYTSEEAIEDGILFDVTTVNPKWKVGLFNYVTTNLMSCGYFNDRNQVNVPNLADLLTQAFLMVKKKSNSFKEQDYLYSGEVELPSGEKQKIFMQMNETGKYTIMLPEDY